MASVMTDRVRTALAGGVLLALPFLVYLPVAFAGFVWDDDSYVTQNAQLRSWAGLVHIWLDPRSIPQYYPLVHTSFWIEHRLWGLAPLGYHLTNVGLHGLGGLLLWRCLVRLGSPGAFFAASLFAVHPVMTESVAWITERKNVLSLSLALGALASYLRFAPLEATGVDAAPGRRSWRAYTLALALYLGALLSKTTACSLPAVILLLTWWKRGRVALRDVIPLAPFFAFGLAAALTTIWLEKHHVGAVGAEWALSPLERVLVAGRALAFYAGKLAWPHPLIFFYPRWQPDVTDPAQWLYPAGVVVLGAALWAARGRIGRGPLAAALIYAGVLVPALGFFDVYPFRYSFVADHFQYAAAPAAIALFAAAVASGAMRLTSRAARNAVRAAAIALVAVLGLLTFRQARIYESLETLYLDTVQKNPGAWQAYINLANHLSAAGRHTEATAYGREAVRAGPRVADAHNTLGGVLVSAVQAGTAGPASLDEGVEELARALAIEPEHVDALYNRAVALTLAGRFDEAADGYRRILELDPNATEARTGQGRALLAAGRPDEAERSLREVVELQPANAQARNDLGVALVQLGRTDAAADQFAEAVRLAPGFTEARSNLARVRGGAGPSSR